MAKYALVIGITQYDQPLRPLPKAAADAEAIAQLLETHHYQVTRLPRKRISENQWAIDPTQRLTGRDFNTELKTFLRDRAANQEAVIFFGGHGFRVANPTTDELEGYIATSDCSNSNGRNAIKFSDFNTLIGGSTLSSLVMLFDCCYAGAIAEQHNLLHGTQTTISAKRNSCLIAACRDFEPAREGKEHGLFTAAVLRGLTPEHANNGEITSNDLLSFVTRELQNSGQEVIHAGMGQVISLIRYATAPTPHPVINESCPYQGLNPFNEATAGFFFGRDRLIQRLQEKLDQTNFIPVIGASGSGKSSVVLAGLIPRLRQSGWQILGVMQPGIEPIAKLKVTLEQFFREQGQLPTLYEIYPQIDTAGLQPVIEHLPGIGKVLLTVDQFEELFTLCANERDRHRFITLLTQVAEQPSRLSIVTTMRADFLEHCLSYRALAQLIQDWKELALPLDEQELVDAIVKPAEQQGYHLENGLLDLILENVREEKNSLPLLQFALTELWQHRNQQAHALTLSCYRDMGGVKGALNRYANQLYESLSQSEQEFVKRACLKLVRTGQEEKDTRQRQPKHNLLVLAPDNQTPEGAQIVLDTLISRRLLVSDEQQGEAWVDLAHEALMESWQVFRDWRKKDRELRRLGDRVEDAARDWIDHHQDSTFLMSDGFLSQVTQRWQELKSYLSPTAQEFYQRSYDRERERISYSTDMQRLKERLQNLQTQLSIKIQERLENRSIDNSPDRPTTEISQDSELLKLQAEIRNFLNLAQRFEDRMQLAQIAADWLVSNQESLAQLMVEYSISMISKSENLNCYSQTPEEMQKVYGDYNRYIDWLRDSLLRGQPIDERLEIPLKYPLTLSREVYAATFEFIKQEWMPNQVSDDVFDELKRYLDYLINYFLYFLS